MNNWKKFFENHTKERAKERYNIDLTQGQDKKLNEYIYSHYKEFVKKRLSRRRSYLVVPWNEKILHIIYSRGMQRILTCLPEENEYEALIR